MSTGCSDLHRLLQYSLLFVLSQRRKYLGLIVIYIYMYLIMSLFVKDESAICCLKCDLIKQVSPLLKNQNVRSIVTDKVNNEGNLNTHPLRYSSRASNAGLQCTASLLPFFPLEDEDDYLNEIRAGSINNDLGHLASLKKITFNLDSFNKHNAPNDEIDPDLNPCLNRLPDALYAAPSALLDKFGRFKEMSNIMHINTRSVGSKMVDLQILLQQVPVSILALTETWLTEESCNLFNLPGDQINYHVTQEREE